MVVCPAHAGVYPFSSLRIPCLYRLPRTRGGLPDSSRLASTTDMFAPHTRGSTRHYSGTIVDNNVCPAHAGVYRPACRCSRPGLGLPRTRGGLPIGAAVSSLCFTFAPHTRGSTQGSIAEFQCPPVCPAHAGVYPLSDALAQALQRLPRTRGGLPPITVPPHSRAKFAPHTRGSTQGSIAPNVKDPLVWVRCQTCNCSPQVSRLK